MIGAEIGTTFTSLFGPAGFFFLGASFVAVGMVRPRGGTPPDLRDLLPVGDFIPKSLNRRH
jgi:hypothetical protein